MGRVRGFFLESFPGREAQIRKSCVTWGSYESYLELVDSCSPLLSCEWFPFCHSAYFNELHLHRAQSITESSSWSLWMQYGCHELSSLSSCTWKLDMKAGYENELIICEIYFVVQSLGFCCHLVLVFFLFFPLSSPPKIMMIVACQLGFSCCRKWFSLWNLWFYSDIGVETPCPVLQPLAKTNVTKAIQSGIILRQIPSEIK